MPVKPHPRPGARTAALSGRPAQKRRTRKAIVDATIALLARGGTPSVNEVATAADVSRRTVYLYFPTFDQLLIDATLGALSQPAPPAARHEPEEGNGEDARVERVVRALQHITPEAERLGRALVRLTVDASAPSAGTGLPRRGYRRLEWLESALAPFRKPLGAVRWRRLVCALAMVAGWEAMIAQRDVCGLTAAEGEELSVWAARALVHAAFEEAQQKRRAT